jgi:hypothetical protein
MSTAIDAFPLTFPDLDALRDGQKSSTGIAGRNITAMSLTGNDTPERIWGMVA